MSAGRPVIDWDAAYANAPAIPQSERWPAAWAEPAAAFRDSASERVTLDLPYGESERERFDLVAPAGEAAGLVVFIHGGFWMKLDKSFWTHLAAGPLAAGWAVALPSYPLAPEARISGITDAIGRAVSAAAERVAGPIRLIGHSAGGHLATRMITETTPLAPAIVARIARVVSVSGLHDLRPLMNTAMNLTLGLDAAEARAESPALLDPVGDASVLAWVGGAELPDFRTQNALLALIWGGLGRRVEAVEEPGRHHFDVLDSLAAAEGALCEALLRDG